MKWSDVSGFVGKAAPVVGSLLGGPAGGAVGSLVASALGVEATPDNVAEALKSDPQAAVKLQQLENEHKQEMRRMVLESESNRLEQINQTMRAEAASSDPYVRRWRPTYGYTTCLTWFLQTCAIVAAIVAASFVYPEHAAEIMTGLAQLMGAMLAMWSIALGVLGVSVRQRSADKQVMAGQAPTGILDIFNRGSK